MKLKIIGTIFLLSSAITFSALSYEDIPKDHWAYSSILNLVEKGIIKEDSYSFRGESTLKRYDFAYYLSKTFNKLNLEKANKKDLQVLESLMSEFSKELTKIGFDTTTFNDNIEDMNQTISSLKQTVLENQRLIADLKKRVEILESKN